MNVGELKNRLAEIEDEKIICIRAIIKDEDDEFTGFSIGFNDLMETKDKVYLCLEEIIGVAK